MKAQPSSIVGCYDFGECIVAFSSEVDTGSRQENASKQEFRTWLVLFQSEPTKF